MLDQEIPRTESANLSSDPCEMKILFAELENVDADECFFNSLINDRHVQLSDELIFTECLLLHCH